MKNIWAIAKITALLIVVQVVLFGSLAQVSAALPPIKCPPGGCPSTLVSGGKTVNPGGMIEYFFRIETGESVLNYLVDVLESVDFEFKPTSMGEGESYFEFYISNNIGFFSQGEIVGRLDYLFSNFAGLGFKVEGDEDNWVSKTKEVIFSNVLASTIILYNSGEDNIPTVGLFCDIEGVDSGRTFTSMPYNPVPEPGTLLLLGLGLLGLAGMGRKRSSL